VFRGFLADEKTRSWWPAGYQDWAHHTFLVFDDGTIADITADQFGNVPQLWWPADETRYTFDTSKPDAAELARNKYGIERWTEQIERDESIPAAQKRYHWWKESHMDPDKCSQLRALSNGGPSRGPRKGARSGRSLQDVMVFKDGQPLQLPPPTKQVTIGEGRPEATFRRISKENELDIWLVEHLFLPEELRQLVRLCAERNGFQPSLQTTTSGQQVVDKRRTSHSCALHWPVLWGNSEERLRRGVSPEVEEELTAAQHVTDLCARALEVDSSYIEPLQLVKYTPGQFYRAHLDTHMEPERQSSFIGEQRTHTLLVFLNDVPEKDCGGHLHFPRLNLRILPQLGNAVLWKNVKGPNGKPDPDSLHEGEPPLKAEKIAMNVWVSDRPFTAQLIEEGRQRKHRQATEAANQPSQPKKKTKEPLLLRKMREWAEDEED